MTYSVIRVFADLQDGNHIYNVGDTFPRDGATASDERITELSGRDNLQGVPLIAEVKPKAKTRRSKKTAEN